MTFSNPQGLWLLALAVPIVAFHLYRGRIRRMPVPTLLFWEQVIVEEERRTAIRRLRHYVSLLLNLAALALLTSAVSGPEVEGLTRKPGRYALVLDNTPSMGAVEEGGRTRLERALGEARRFVRSRGYGDAVSFHDLARVRAPMTRDLERLSRRLVPVPPVRGDGVARRVREALSAGDDVTAVLLTDRPPEGVDDLLERGRLRVARVGSPAANTGWIAGTPVRRLAEKRFEIRLTLASFSDEAVEREEVLRFRGAELARRTVKLGPGARMERSWTLHPPEHPGAGLEAGGRVEVALEPPDGFPIDDRASFVLPPLTPPPVIVFHPGEPDGLLMHALDVLASRGVISTEIGVSAVEGYASVRDRVGEGWILVFDRVRPPAVRGHGGLLIFGAPGTGAVEQPTLADWDREAPPNRLVDYSGFWVRRSRILEGRPLVTAVEGPIAVWEARGGRATAEFGFAFSDVDLRTQGFVMVPFLVGFAEWASWSGLRSFRTAYRTGEPLRPDRPLWVEAGDVGFTQLRHEEHAAVRDGWPSSVPRGESGFARITAGARTEWTAVNLFDAGESDLREPAPPEGPLPAPPPPVPWHARVPWAALAAGLVLALLLLEAWLFHRGLI